MRERADAIEAQLRRELIVSLNALNELAAERDGLLNQVDELKRTIVEVEAHRDRVIESVTQFCKDINAVESDRDMVLAHAARFYWMVCEADEAVDTLRGDLTATTDHLYDTIVRDIRREAMAQTRLDAATVRAEAMRREVERQRGVIAELHKERDEARQNAYDQKRDERGRFTASISGTQRRKDRAAGRRRK